MRQRKEGIRRWSSLQVRMTISYVWVTTVAVLLLEMLVFILVATPLFSGQGSTVNVQLIAQSYALTVASSDRTTGLDHYFSFQRVAADGRVKAGVGKVQENQLTVPYIGSAAATLNAKNVQFALLVGPDMHVFASSYPVYYAPGVPVARLLGARGTQLITKAMTGAATNNLDKSNGIVSAVEPVLQDQRVVGAVYVQAPFSSFDNLNVASLLRLAASLLGSGVVLLLVTVPIGTLFGIITTRRLVKRVRRLASVTTTFAAGDYSERVHVMRKDEVGQLEHQFNRMAEELATSIERREELARQNARLAERSRISRELHDAISQDLFSLSMLSGGLQAALTADSPLYPQAKTLEQTTTNMIREMRTLLLELRPTQLEHAGLAKALEECAVAYSRRLSITITASIASVKLDAKSEHALLRITQEALANAARYASASLITLSLLLIHDGVELVITDNGIGFEPESDATRHGLGLRLMQERVQELHGTFALHSMPGQGTSIQVQLPMEQ